MSNQFYMPAPATPQTFEELRRYTQTELERIEKGFMKVTSGFSMVGGGGGGASGWGVDGGSSSTIYLADQVIDCGASLTTVPSNAFDGGPANG